MGQSREEARRLFMKALKARYAEAFKADGRDGLRRELYRASGYDADADDVPIMTYEEWLAGDGLVRPMDDLLTFSPLEEELRGKLV